MQFAELYETLPEDALITVHIANESFHFPLAPAKTYQDVLLSIGSLKVNRVEPVEHNALSIYLENCLTERSENNE